MYGRQGLSGRQRATASGLTPQSAFRYISRRGFEIRTFKLDGDSSPECGHLDACAPVGMGLMKLSIVATFYRSEQHLQEFCTRIQREAESITSDYEIVLVNDGSPDNSLDIALSQAEQNSRFRIVDLSRNFGHHPAIVTGLAQATGELVFLIDSDLEEPPELLGLFYAEMQRVQAEVVYGVQERRKGSLFERLSGAGFYAFFDLLTDYPVPANQLVARLMTCDFVTASLQYQERCMYLPGLWMMTGFRQTSMVVQKYSKGSSTYTLRRKIAIAVDSITSFSTKPLVYIFYLGTIIVLLSLLGIGYLIVGAALFGDFALGWPSVMVSVWFLGGLMIFCLGLIGIYLSKVLTEIKRRPYTIVRRLH